MLPPLDIELTMENHFTLSAMELTIKNMPREELEQMLLSSQRQLMAMRVAFNNVICNAAWPPEI